MTAFYLVRHAHADWTADDRRPLSERGRGDALAVAELLAGRPIQAVFSSPYARARQTVEPLAARLGLALQEVEGLRERSLGHLAGLGFLEAVRASWADFELIHPGGESSAAAQRRGVAALYALGARHPDDEIVVATHGNLLALILNHFDATLDFQFWQALTMPDVYHLSLPVEGAVSLHRLRTSTVR